MPTLWGSLMGVAVMAVEGRYTMFPLHCLENGPPILRRLRGRTFDADLFRCLGTRFNGLDSTPILQHGCFGVVFF